MTSPYTSAATSTFNLSGNSNLDPLLDETHQKWGGALGKGANLSFSFPWINGNSAYWQDGYGDELSATEHFGFNVTQMTAARNALQAWANVANLNISEVSDTSSNVGDFRFAFSSALDSGTWGYSFYPNSSAKAADVWINSTNGSDSDWSVGSYDYEALMHEIGHGLGLKHPGNYNGEGSGTPPFLPSDLDFRNYTIMSYNDPANDHYWDSGKNTSVLVAPETPMVYDILAIQYLYGANTHYHTGNDTYTFSPNNPFYETIWDAGGNDTIDISNFTLGSTISLNPGSYSTIAFPAPGSSSFNGTNDLGIAFGTLIENAVGGSGNDTFIGNSISNHLDGGTGIDTMVYSGNKSEYSINKISDNAYTVTNNFTSTKDTAMTDTKKIDTLTNIERIQFADTMFSLSDVSDSSSGSKLDSPKNLSGGISGNVVLNGGNNIDTVSYAIPYSEVTAITQSKDGSWAISYNMSSSTGGGGGGGGKGGGSSSGSKGGGSSSSSGGKGGGSGTIAATDTLHSIERLNFSDGVNVALDINSPDQVAGAALALLYAGFHSLPDETTFGHWIAKADLLHDSSVFDNSKVENLAQEMLTEYVPNGISNSALINILYTNVVGHTPDSGELNYFSQLLDKGTYSQAGLLALAAESNLNTEQYATLIGNGLQYVPEHGKVG